MSLQLLHYLNGNSKGLFWSFINRFNGVHRIAWYPSSGMDFRGLMFLSIGYAKFHPASIIEPSPPDLFIFSDYNPSINFIGVDNLVYQDDRTTVEFIGIEKLETLCLPLNDEIVVFNEKKVSYGSVYFINVRVSSIYYDTIVFPVLYVIAENEAFCAEVLLKQNAKLSHIIHVRYGAGFGGARATGSWLLNVLKPLGTEVFITDNHLSKSSGDEAAIRLYPNLRGIEGNLTFETIRVIKSRSWSGHGDVSWNVIY